MNKKMLSYFNLSELPFSKEIPTQKLLKLPVLILDEAHLLSHDILQEIRLLTTDIFSDSQIEKAASITLTSGEISYPKFQSILFWL